MRFPARAIIIAALLLVFLAVGSGQSRVQRRVSDQERPFRFEVDAVNLLVAVNDKKTGKFITNLEPSDFEIEEDGVRQTISNFIPQTEQPLTIAMCVDTSASVKVKLDFEKRAALDFLFTIMRPKDRTLLAEFDTGVQLLHDFTHNPNDLAREIENLRAGGGTSLYDAIYLVAEQKMLEERGRKTMVILSDGSDLTSSRTYDEALRMAHLAEVVIYAISTTRFGADIEHEGERALKELTEDTGGRVYFPYSEKQFTEAFKEIEQELRSQYNITYIPSNRKKDGSYRKIKVKVRHDDVVVRYRKGYFAQLSSATAGGL